MSVMSKAITKQLKVSIRKIEKQKNEIGKHRDVLRDIVDDVEMLLESTEYGIEDMNEAISLLRSAIDHISEQT